MAKKRIIMVLLILVLVCGGAFGGVLGWAGWGLVLGGGISAGIGLIGDQPQQVTLGAVFAGSGLLLVLIDLVFSDNSSTALAPSENPVLEHVSLGIVPNAAYVGANFHF